MNAVGWMWLRRLLQIALSPAGKANCYSQRRRETAPSLQALEAIELLSTGAGDRLPLAAVDLRGTPPAFRPSLQDECP